MKKIKVLIITSGLTAGGVDTLILNTLSVMNKKEFHIDILVFDDSKVDWKYKYENYGCKILIVDRARKQGVLTAIKSYRKIFKNGKYDIIHTHIGYGSVLPVIACAFVKNCKVITHAHYDNFNVNYSIEKIGHLLFNIFPCVKLACSIGAGKALYGKRSRFMFIKNGIDSEKFSFDQKTRNDVRKELGLDEKTFTVGSVGRMQYQKNHEFLLDIFSEIKKGNIDSKLVLVGDGELREDIYRKTCDLNLVEAVIFLGIRNDVYRLLQAMDVFIMPTRFEGLSLALLEVQCAGLPCLTTDVVPKEAKVLPDLYFLSLKQTANEWAQYALRYLNFERNTGLELIKSAKFDKENAGREWFSIYKKVVMASDTKKIMSIKK